jgi:hypothetical protein
MGEEEKKIQKRLYQGDSETRKILKSALGLEIAQRVFRLSKLQRGHLRSREIPQMMPCPFPSSTGSSQIVPDLSSATLIPCPYSPD